MRGGKRPGAGRKAGSGRFGEPTVQMRVPESLVPQVTELITKCAINHSKCSANDPWDDNGYKPAIELPKPGSSLILPPIEAEDCLVHLLQANVAADCVILDPWYSPSPHRFRQRSNTELTRLISLAGDVAKHVFIWGWPCDVATLIERIPSNLRFSHWLTWHYTNVPSRSHGWRPTQQACLHLSTPKARMYPQNLRKDQTGLYRYGADSVISAGALVGRAGRSQSTGHPAQKPEAVFEPLILMTTPENGLVIDPTCGSATAGAVANKLNRRAVLSDRSDRFIRQAEKRLGITRAYFFYSAVPIDSGRPTSTAAL